LVSNGLYVLQKTVSRVKSMPATAMDPDTYDRKFSQEIAISLFMQWLE